MTRPLILFGAAGLVAVALAAGFGLGRLTPKPASPAAADGRKALYWYDPMVPTQHFEKPGKSPFMDMQLVPKYADEASGAAASPGVAIDPTQAQSLGVRYATVSKTQLGESITAPAVIDFNQRDLAIVQARTGGFVQRVYARAPGDVVAAGAPFADVLVPEWAGAQTEFLAVLHTEDAGLIAASRQRLALLGMSPAVIAEVEKSGKPKTITTITTPTGGVIRTLSVRAGMTLTAGQTLAEVSGLGTVWVNASVPADLASTLRTGQSAQVTVTGDGAQPISGKVAVILPEVSGDSRTLQVRVELPNPGGRLRPGGFATVAFVSMARPALTVPSEAVIRTGQRALVMVALPGGRFQAAEVQVGAESGGRTEVMSGLTEGEKVVASGQFLIDSEASLSGVQARTATPMAMADKPAAATPATYETTGRIERLDATSVTLSHAPVPAIGWPAMTMAFRLPDPALGKGFKVGDQVRFSFARPNEGPTIHTITKGVGQ
jgi:Cu(I)/Ag(I) efflux system membrane fusion protein